ncbi:hypothetical protein FDA52_02015 [Clostridium botulinum]|nr:hypothetical protein [Clostridium botulinum]
MMQEGILLPKNITNIKYINSGLKKYLENSKSAEQIYPIDFLRVLYQEDRNKFYKIIEEMKLRGFEFIFNKNNNVLPNYIVDTYPYILVDKLNGQGFKEIDFSNIGLGGFINKFNVIDDGFFNFVPLNGFKMLNNNIDIETLRKNFERVNFRLICDEKNHKVEMDKVLNEEIEKREDKNSNEIDVLFSENKYVSFKAFCKERNITLLSEITDGILQDYSMQKYIGIGKLNAVRSLLEESNYFDVCGNGAQKIVVYYGYDSIEKVFSDNKYNKFVDYCKSKDINIIGQLTSENLIEFSNTSNIGRKKVADVTEILANYIKCEREEFSNLKFDIGDLSDNIKGLYINDIIRFLDIDITFVDNRKIAELEGYTYEQLKESYNIYDLYEVNKRLRNLKSLNEIISESFSSLDDRKLKFIREKNIENKTLEQIGKENNCTRERVRQLVKEGEDKLINSLKLNGFLTFMRLNGKYLSYITKERAIDLLGEYSKLIINIMEKNDNLIFYNDTLEIFYFDQEYISLNILLEYLDELPEIIVYYEYRDEFRDIFTKVGVVDLDEKYIENVFRKLGLIKYGEALCKSKLTSTMVLEYIFENYIKEPIRVDKEGVKYLDYLSKKHLNYPLEITVKSVEGRVRESNKIILVDKLSFCWHNEEVIPDLLIKSIDEYIIARFEEVDQINCEELFNKFKVDFKKCRINTKQYVNSIVKYYLGEKYEVGHGNTLNIYKDENGKLDREQILSNKLLELGGQSTKEKLSETLNWPIYKIEQTVSSSNEMLMWDKYGICHINNILITVAEIEELIKIINLCLKDGFTTSYMILNEMRFDKILAGLINKNNISKGNQVANLIKIYCDKFKINRQFITNETCISKSFEDVVIYTFNDKTSRSEILKFYYKYGYKEITSRNMLNKLLMNKIYIETDEDTLHYYEKVKIDNDVIDKLIKYIEGEMGEKEYLSLSLLKGYKMKLPRIDFRWNQYLIKSLLVERGYKHFIKKFNDYRFDKLVVARENSVINTFEELIAYVIKYEYKGNMHETFLYDFLAEKGILRQQNLISDKKFPYEIKNGELINIDEFGTVTLK